jgi:heme/copper-type cytochrome/quinol oxidase subunit 3
MLPKTSLGRWSLYLAIAFILVFALFVVLTEVPTDFNGPPPGFNPVALLTLEVIVITAAGATFITGLISVSRNKERSVLVFIGMVITFWLGLIGAVGQFLI